MSQINPHTGLIAWFAHNHVAANLLMVVIVLTGLASAFTIRTQMTPELEFDQVNVDVSFPGASPGEVESGVINRIEEAVRQIEGLSELRSVSGKGFGNVVLRVDPDYEVLNVLDEVKLAVDRIVSMPEEAEKPRIYTGQRERGVVNIQIFGDMNELSMKRFAETIREELLALPRVSKAEIQGAREYEISIELEESRLRQYQLTLDQIAQAIRLSSLDLSAGSIKSDSGDILLRTQSQAYLKQDFEKIVLISDEDGTRLTLADIATVTDGFVEQRFFSLFNGQPSIGVRVFAVSDENQIEISKEVNEYITQRATNMPDGVHLQAWMDGSEFLNSTRNMMLGNMISGVILVLIILGIFLRLQLAFWVMLGMPIAFLGAFALLPLVGGSINAISLFGFIIVLGIVVDDAIIIGESVQYTTDQDGHSLDNVIKGAQRVATPATFGVLTTVATFVPLLLVSGTVGEFPAAIGWVVILCLLFSIVESKLILPAHLASMKPLPQDPKSKAGLIRRFQDWFARGLKKVTFERYEPFLIRCIHQRYVTISVFIGMFILSLGFIMGPYIKVVAFPNMSSNYLRAQIALIDGSSTEQAIKVVSQVSNSLARIDEQRPEAQKFIRNMASYTRNTNGSIMVELRDNSDSHLDPEAIANEWRNSVGGISGTKTLEFVGSEKSHGNSHDIEFKLLSSNGTDLASAAQDLERQLQQYEGVYDIENSNTGNIPEINLKITPSAEALGLSLRDLASQVRAAFYGVEAQRIQRGREEVKVMVRYPKSERESLGNLENMYIRTPQGDEVPFSSVATIDSRLSPSRITHSWGKRSVTISANVDKTTIQPGQIVRDITQGPFSESLHAKFPSVRIELGGASLEEEEFKTESLYMATLALFAIYALMAIPLKSYTQPLIIMVVIPFGMIGALIGHVLIGINFSSLSMMGIIALAGVVVNDSILMVDFVNKAVDEGMTVLDAAIQSGTRRFRAIMLTSLTTFFGLLPILLETSLTAQLVTPMAVSLGFGILFATVITLILIPCLYMVLEDLKLGRRAIKTLATS